MKIYPDMFLEVPYVLNFKGYDLIMDLIRKETSTDSIRLLKSITITNCEITLKLGLFEKTYFSDHRKLKLFECTGLNWMKLFAMDGKELNLMFLNDV